MNLLSKATALFFASLMFVSIAYALPKSVELLSVFAEGASQITDANYLKARKGAMKQALERALWNVAGILVPPDQMELNRDVIEEMINSRGMDFVQSYKFISEVKDEENGEYKLDLQVTFFLGHFRSSLAQVGLALESGNQPKVVLVIDERAIGIVPDSNFLLLPSSTEKQLKSSVTKLGYNIVDRSMVRGLKEDLRVLSAVKGDAAAVLWLSEMYGASYLILGQARAVASAPGEDGPGWVDGEISARIYDGRSASLLMSEKVTHRVEGGRATDSFKAIRMAAAKLNLVVVEFLYNRAAP